MDISRAETNTLFESSLIDKEEICKRHDSITNCFHTLEEEKWMKDIYQIITTSSLNELKSHKTYNGKLVGITLPKPLINEVLNFKNINDYLNQFKLFMILLFIEKDSHHYPDKYNKIFLSLQRYFQKKQIVIYDILIQQYVHDYFACGYISASEYLDESYFLRPDSIWNLITYIKQLYNNEMYQTNYTFPLNDEEINSFVQKAEDIYDTWDDENNNEVLEQIKKINLEFIYKMIKPISDINIDYLFDMAIEQSIYLEYKSKSKMEFYEFNDFYIQSLYIKLTKQPKMSFLRHKRDLEIDLYFAELEVKTNFKWEKEHEPYQFSMVQVDYINHMKNGKSITINKNSSKFKGDQYEKFCELWLQENGYRDTEIVGQKGDKGIDIKAIHPNGKKIGIQCKYKDMGTVNSKDIRILHIAKEYYDIEKTLLIANCSLSSEAIKDMAKFDVEAIILPYTEPHPSDTKIK